MIKKTVPKQRNPLVVAALMRRAGTHTKPGKVIRRKEKVQLLKYKETLP